MQLTDVLLLACFPETPETTRTAILPGLVAACLKYDINTPLRISAFLAEIGYESGSFRYKDENLNYTALELLGIFHGMFTNHTAALYAHNPEMIANRVYANKNGNGDESSGDGWRFRGRGWIQVTWRCNYEAFALDCGLQSVQAASDFADTDAGASMISAWFWGKLHDLNTLADQNNIADITRKINPGMLGKTERASRFKKYKIILGA